MAAPSRADVGFRLGFLTGPGSPRPGLFAPISTLGDRHIVNLGYPQNLGKRGERPNHLLRWQAIRRTLVVVSEKPPPVRRGRL